MIGTNKEDTAFSTRAIGSFEAIPSFSKRDGGGIFPSKRKRTERGLKIQIDTVGTGDGDIIAAIILPDTGLRVEYKFVKFDGCWRLVEIDDRST